MGRYYSGNRLAGDKANQTTPQRRLLIAAEDLSGEPNRGDEYMDRISEKGGLVAFDQMSQPRQRKRRGNQRQGDHPMPPDNDHGRESDRDCDHMQGAIDWMVVCAVIVRVETHVSTPTAKSVDARALYSRDGESPVSRRLSFEAHFATRTASNLVEGLMSIFRPVHSVSLILIVFFYCALLGPLRATLHGQNAPVVAGNDHVKLSLNTDEADAVLAILDNRASGTAITEGDWQHLFATEPYVRLKKREAGMHRDFSDAEFRNFVLSPELGAKTALLHRTLDAWKQIDLVAPGQRVLSYLPERAVIKAKVFPMIKPRTNSFVFETQSDPAIFLYLDPEESAVKFENTVAHELHHIGYSSIRSLAEDRQRDVPPDAKPAVEWMGAFGEGFAVLAAAGSPDVDPHAASSSKERARWSHDLANFRQDVVSLQQFFLDIVERKLVGKDKIDERAFSFFGDAQGPWYTVGYKMAIIIEKRFGRKILIECMLDPRELLARYNQATEELSLGGGEKLPLWSSELLRKIGTQR